MTVENSRDISVARLDFQLSLTRKPKSPSEFDHLEIIIPVTVGGIAILLMVIAMCCVYFMKRRLEARTNVSHTTPKPANTRPTVNVTQTSSEFPNLQSAPWYINENCNTVDPDHIELLYIKPNQNTEPPLSIETVD
ncbi:uncharacterized protein LOC144927896 [Branchiostoma floridae x Branchiostoma belcheri]